MPWWTRSVFLVDDNFIGHKAKAKALLRELIAWRRRRGAATTFLTEVSLNLADSPELLELMAQAGFKRVFVGIESPDDASLAECMKAQNRGRHLVSAVKTIQNAGIEVMGGFIVGFDNDGAGIFDRQLRFIQDSGVVTAMVGLLTALPKTRLFARLQREGRIVGESTGNNLDGALNFIPKLDREVLLQGYRALLKRLYAPKNYYARASTFLREYRPQGPRERFTCRDVFAFLRSLWVLGVWTRGRRAYWKYLVRAFVLHRKAFAEAMDLAIKGYHFRKIAEQL